MFIDILDLAQRANNIIARSEFERLEKAYEDAFIAAVQFRNAYPRAEWSREQRTAYNELLNAFDIAKTDLMQFTSLRNRDSEILY